LSASLLSYCAIPKDTTSRCIFQSPDASFSQ
jgi:hypothetical protein